MGEVERMALFRMNTTIPTSGYGSIQVCGMWGQYVKCGGPSVPQRSHRANTCSRREPTRADGPHTYVPLVNVVATAPVVWYMIRTARVVAHPGYNPAGLVHLYGVGVYAMDTNSKPVTEEEIAAGFRKSDGKRIIDHRSNDQFDATDRFNDHFDHIVREIVEPVRGAMIESVPDTGLELNHDSVIAQVLMNLLGEHDCGSINGQFHSKTKVRLVEMADWMGPDWAQALYHAAVFITKVA